MNSGARSYSNHGQKVLVLVLTASWDNMSGNLPESLSALQSLHRQKWPLSRCCQDPGWVLDVSWAAQGRELEEHPLFSRQLQDSSSNPTKSLLISFYGFHSQGPLAK